MGSDQTLNITEIDEGLIQGPKEFFIDTEKELARVERYGHKATFLLIKPHINSDNSKEDYIKFLYSSISKELRHCDSVYLFDSETLAAILPHTHEAGGETAAVRIKKKISQAGTRNGKSIPMSIGVVCVWPGQSLNTNDLIHELKGDLERDQKCQFLPGPQRARKKRQKICFLVEEDSFSRKISLSKGIFDTVWDQQGFADPNEFDAVVIDKNFKTAENVDLGRINRVLPNKIDIYHKEQELRIYFRYAPDLDRIIESLFEKAGGRETGPANMDQGVNEKVKSVLSAIGSSTHQLNQPLQIIMGKIELLLLDLSMDANLSIDQLIDALRQLKDQVHYAAEINAKINRLTKL